MRNKIWKMKKEKTIKNKRNINKKERQKMKKMGNTKT